MGIKMRAMTVLKRVLVMVAVGFGGLFGCGDGSRPPVGMPMGRADGGPRDTRAGQSQPGDAPYGPG